MGLKKIWGCGRFFLKGIRDKKISGKRGLGLLPCAENDGGSRRNDEEEYYEIPAFVGMTNKINGIIRRGKNGTAKFR